MNFSLGHIIAALPEIALAGMTLLLLLVGAFSSSSRAVPRVRKLAVFALLATGGVMHWTSGLGINEAFPRTDSITSALFITNDFTYYVKALILALTTLVLLAGGRFWQVIKHEKFEYDILVLLATIGMMVMVSAYDWLAMYMGLELMSFSLYILAAFRRDDGYSTEAGLKYFVLGSLASGVMLYGISLLYGLVGDTGYNSTLAAIAAPSAPLMTSVALVMVLSALAFKVSAAPFHVWAPDVYQGAPTPVTAFMATAPKVAAFALLMKVLNVPFASLLSDWSPLVMVMAILSMALGSIMALMQNNLKRLLAFSAISNAGFILVGVMLGTPVSVMAVLVYLTFYTLTTVGIFALLMSLRHKDVFLEDLDDLAGFARQYPVPGLALLMLLFSLAGVPPLSGFFAKFYIFAAAVQAGFTWLAVLSVVFAVIGAAYCLKILKVLFFDDPIMHRTVDLKRTGLSRYVGYAMAVLALLFGLLPNLITEWATVAAQGLF